MSSQECAKCGDISTPWYWCLVLKDHICIECYYEIHEEEV